MSLHYNVSYSIRILHIFFFFNTTFIHPINFSISKKLFLISYDNSYLLYILTKSVEDDRTKVPLSNTAIHYWLVTLLVCTTRRVSVLCAVSTIVCCFY